MKSSSIPLSIVLAMTTSATVAQLRNENLLTTIPDGYKTDFQDKTSDMLISEMVPVDQA
jgi:hypothetical protein